MDLISENTGITIGVVIVLIGGVVWLTKLHSLASTNARRLKQVERMNNERDSSLGKRIDLLETETNTILERMARIETKLDFLIENLKK